MALTEPQAGSSLSDIATRAEPTDQGHYTIRGQKIFISAGDHDGVENVVHMLLAKIPGAPPGVKGISLFLVPKQRLEGDGTLTPNDVNVTTVYHKLGYRGCPITQLSMGDNDDCRGYLVGEPHKGLSYMFQMMNEARLGVGMQATAIASAAYYASLEYAKQRPQGRRLTSKDPMLPQIPIIDHADVRRMLLFQRAVTEGSLSVILQCSLYADLARTEDTADKERYELLLDLLTPVAKSYPSEYGIISVSQGLQVLGGYRVMPGVPAGAILSGHQDTSHSRRNHRHSRPGPARTEGGHEEWPGHAPLLRGGTGCNSGCAAIRTAPAVCRAIEGSPGKIAGNVTMNRVQCAMQGNVDVFLADATLYLELFGIVVIAWQWLIQGVTAQKGLEKDCSEPDRRFYEGKLHTMRYFFQYEVPKTFGLAARLMETDALTVEMSSATFDD